MRKSKTATLGIWLCVFALAILFIEYSQMVIDDLQKGGKLIVIGMNLLHYVPGVLALILRIVMFARNKVSALFPVIAILVFATEIRPIYQVIKLQGFSGLYLYSTPVQIALAILPTLMLLIMALNRRNKRPTLFYLPAALYFVLSIANMAFDYLDPMLANFSLWNYTTIILWTALMFVTGLFIRDN